MAKIIGKRIRWTPATTPDIVAHRIYVSEEPNVPDYSSVHIEKLMPETECIAPGDFPAGTFATDANYYIGISSVDDVGNESDITVISAPFDFVAPGAPSSIIVEDL